MGCLKVTEKKNTVNTLKFNIEWFYHGVRSPDDATGIANSGDPDQTAHQGLFVQKFRIVTVML